ncbi:MAG: endonuclease/exonuclease/phosphatase family protein [Planctomycetota bacterium]
MGESLRVVTLNLGHGRGTASHQALLKRMRIQSNLDGIASVLRQEGPDIVGLQEADAPSWWSGGFDHVDYLAMRSEYPHRFHGRHRDIAQIRSGTALLSRRPLAETFSAGMWSGALRPVKGYVVAAVEVGGVVVDVVSVHVDFASRGRRRIQLGKMATELKRRDRPVVILGDLNCSWGREPTLRELSTRLDLVAFRPDADGLATFPHGRPKRRIDWILASRGTEYKRYEVISTPLSDHRAVVADLIIS